MYLKGVRKRISDYLIEFLIVKYIKAPLKRNIKPFSNLKVKKKIMFSLECNVKNRHYFRFLYFYLHIFLSHMSFFLHVSRCYSRLIHFFLLLFSSRTIFCVFFLPCLNISYDFLLEHVLQEQLVVKLKFFLYHICSVTCI